jgi:hypothetical protein
MSFPSTNRFCERVKRLTLIRNDSLHEFYVKLVLQPVVSSEIAETSDETIGEQNEFSRISVDLYWQLDALGLNEPTFCFRRRIVVDK